jgi:hypothetical protein
MLTQTIFVFPMSFFFLVQSRWERRNMLTEGLLDMALEHLETHK